MPLSAQVQLKISALQHRFDRLPHWRLSDHDLKQVAILYFDILHPLVEEEDRNEAANNLIQQASRMLTELETRNPSTAADAAEDERMRAIYEPTW